MSKRRLSPDEAFQLRGDLQRATIAALMASRRWAPGEIAFQGGTALHLAHGSVRFSEDLDFMIRGGMSLDGLAEAVRTRLALGSNVAPDLQLSVSPSRAGRNPHAFDVTLSGPNVIGSARVKVELWQTEASVLRQLALVVRQVQTPAGMASAVPVLTREEILADKVYALGARARLKPRDVYDLWWLHEGGVQLDAHRLLERLQIYPGPERDRCLTARAWIASAHHRLATLRASSTVDAVAADLRRWLPGSFPMDAGQAASMVEVSARSLEQGLRVMQAHEQQLCGQRPPGLAAQ